MLVNSFTNKIVLSDRAAFTFWNVDLSGNLNTYHAMSNFSRRQTDDFGFCFFFPR